MEDELPVAVRRERGVVIAEVTGDIDMSTAAGLRDRLSGLAGSGQPLIVDLNRITFIDSAGPPAGWPRGTPRQADGRRLGRPALAMMRDGDGNSLAVPFLDVTVWDDARVRARGWAPAFFWLGVVRRCRGRWSVIPSCRVRVYHGSSWCGAGRCGESFRSGSSGQACDHIERGRAWA